MGSYKGSFKGSFKGSLKGSFKGFEVVWTALPPQTTTRTWSRPLFPFFRVQLPL